MSRPNRPAAPNSESDRNATRGGPPRLGSNDQRPPGSQRNDPRGGAPRNDQRNDQRGGGAPRNDQRGGNPPRNDQRGPSAQQRDDAGGFGRTAGRDSHTVDFEYVLMTPKASTASEVRSSWLPMKWVSIETPRLMTPGIFIRRGGGLSKISPDLRFDPLSVFVLWDDPDLSLPAGGRAIKPGCNIGVLVPGPKDGPPFVPLHVVLRPQQSDYETGLLSPALDHIGCRRARFTLELDRGELVATSTDLVETGDADAPLIATMRWLSQNPTDDSPGAALSRRMLIESGHGMQRLGVLLAHRTVAERTAILEEMLPQLAPEAAPVLSALWQVFHPAQSDSRDSATRFLALVEALSAELGRDAALQTPRGVALIMTWVFGLFGFRPDRDHAQPARALFAAVSAARSVSRHLDALQHRDSGAPSLPLNRADSSRLLREALNVRDGDATPLETAIRAMAIAEWGVEIARPRLDTLRPFATLLGGLQGFPIATRTLIGRYAGVITGWSLRGAELGAPRLDAASLHAALITDAPDPTISRALGRAIGRAGTRGEPLARAIGASAHPIGAAIAENAGVPLVDLVERLRDTANERRFTPRRLHVSIALIEQIAATVESGAPIDTGWLPLPEAPGGTSVRAQFMYWRAFCRGNIGALGVEQAAWLPTVVSMLPALPDRFALEATALLRGLARQNAAAREALVPHAEVFTESLDRTLSATGQFDAERTNNLLSVLADIAPDVFVAQFDRVLRRDDWARFEPARTLDSARRSPALGALVASSCFARLHRLAADLVGPDGAAVRGEWLRAALEKARRRNDIRWLTDARTMHAFLSSPRFVAWFADHAHSATTRPDDALVELLEQAIRVVGDSDLDRLLSTIRRATRWPDSELIRALADAGRHLAVARVMIRTGSGDSEQVANVVAALAGGNATDLAAAASLVAATARRGVDFDPGIAAPVAAALAAYPANRYVLDGFATALDAARVLRLDPTSNGWRKNLDRAVAWGTETGNPSLVRFVGYAADQAAAQIIENVALNGTAIGEAIDQASPPSALIRALAAKNRSQNARRIAQAIAAGAGRSAALGAIALRTVANDASLDHIAQTVAALLAELTRTAPSTVPEPAEEPIADGDETANSAPESEAPAAGSAEASAELEALRAVLRDIVLNATRRWHDLLTEAGGGGAFEPARLAAEVAWFGPRVWSLRDDVIGAIESLCNARNIELRDELRLLHSEALETNTVALDLEDLRLAVETLIGVARDHRARPTLELERARVMASFSVEAADTIATAETEQPGQTVAVPAEERASIELPSDESADTGSTGDHESDGGPGDAGDETSDSTGEEQAEGVSDEETGEASAEDAPAGETPVTTDTNQGRKARGRRDDTPNPAKALASRFSRALRGKAATDDVALFGGAAQLALVRAALERNPELRLEFSAEKRRVVISVWWRGPR